MTFVFEFVESSDLKVFLIKRNKVLFKQIYKIEDVDIEQLCQSIKANISTYFSRNDQSSNLDINKDQIDEAQIIYSYLKSNACQYLIIPEDWLCSENHLNIEGVINELIKSKKK